MLYQRNNIHYKLSDILRQHWWSFFHQYNKWVRPVVIDTVKKIMNCRTYVFGYHLYGCPDCGHRVIVPHSCKSRFCSVCGKVYTDKWASEILNNLIDVAYHHLIFTIPWELRLIALLNRKVFFNILFKAAVKSVQDWAISQRQMRMGIICVLHTFGSQLTFHPHIHVIVTGGGLSVDGTRWITTNPKFLMPHAGLKKRWRYNVTSLLRKAHKSGELRFSQKTACLKEYKCFNGLLNKVYQYMWYVFIGASLLDPTVSVKYIGRYTKRAVLAEYRIVYCDDKIIRFLYKDYADDSKPKYKTLYIFSFIARLIRHIPDERFPMIRHCGIFANKYKAKYLSTVRHLLGQDDDNTESQRTSTLNWRERQKAFTGKDPLICPYCHKEMVLLDILFGSHDNLKQIWDSVFEEQLKPG
jgi:hypothetical protein